MEGRLLIGVKSRVNDGCDVIHPFGTLGPRDQGNKENEKYLPVSPSEKSTSKSFQKNTLKSSRKNHYPNDIDNYPRKD